MIVVLEVVLFDFSLKESGSDIFDNARRSRRIFVCNIFSFNTLNILLLLFSFDVMFKEVILLMS